jgi:predicted enzyme related to lactoylglutathione lyase
MPRVVHFELGADNPDRAASFYSKVFGWKTKKWDGPQDYWMITTGADGQPGINGGLMRRQGPQPCTAVIDVPSVDEYASRITKNGGRIVMPKMAVPGVGYLAYFADTEGTVIGIMQFDEAAR